MVLIATWYTTFGIKKTAEEVDVKVSLATLVLRGTVYFVVLFILNVLSDISLWVANVCEIHRCLLWLSHH